MNENRRDNYSRNVSLASALGQRVLVLDGSMGVMLQQLNLSEAEVKGRRFLTHAHPLGGNFDVLCLSRPEIVASIHKRYLEAGADIIETNTFNANRFSQSAYGCEHLVGELNRAGAMIARKQADIYSEKDPSKPRFVAGSMGPTGLSASISADVDDPASRPVTFGELAEAYEEQACGLIEGGVDLLLVETIFDLLNAKAAVTGIKNANRRLGRDVPFALSITISDASGRLLSGHTPEAFLTAMAEYRPLAVGFNCSAGASGLEAYVRELASKSPFPVIFYSNAGLPDQMGRYVQTADQFASQIKGLLTDGLLNIVGGCCGTSPEHIAALRQAVDESAKPRQIAEKESVPGWLASLEPFYDNRGFINVGERCNVAGSRKFLRLINEGDYGQAIAIARKQVADGAMMLDLNFDDAMLDSKAEMIHFLRLLASDPQTASVPWMIDSSDFDVIAGALENIAGKAVVNSISLKHGEEELLRQARIVKNHGAAVVVMLFDEQGQATSYERKIEIAGRAYRLLVDEAGFDPRDIIIDPNVLTVATGMAEHDSYALDFIRAIKWIHENLPGAKTSGGVSNLSFAFRGNNYLRQAMHAVFLYHAIEAGLSMAIVDPSTKVTYADIPEDLLELIEDVILMRRPDAADRLIAAAANYSSTPATQSSADSVKLREMPVEQRLTEALRTGDDTNLEADILEAVESLGSATAVVEGPLMAGMEEVGRLFEQGKMFLPQVVKSARTMHKAVGFLTPYLAANASEGLSNGTFLLATVKGDVHDIGKNIVKVVLECNNFKVIDLGVQVEAEAIVRAVREHNPDFIGLSGLIAPSLEEMRVVVATLQREGVSVPVFVGGAATSELHTALRLAPAYPGGVVARISDASQNPLMAKRLLTAREETIEAVKERQRAISAEYQKKNSEKSADTAGKILQLDWANRAFVKPVREGLTINESIAVGQIRELINWTYFYNCWKIKPVSEQAATLKAEAEELLDRLEKEGATMEAAVAFHPAWSDGDAIVTDGVRIPTPRQQAREGREHCLSLADFVAPKGYGDHIGCFVVTIGPRLREEIEACRQEGDDYRMLLIQSVCDRLVEATSEQLHYQVRSNLWGYASDEERDIASLLKGRYAGIRPAVGYPSLPDQRLMFSLAKLVDFDSVGVSLTVNGALTPASSIAGFYISSPESRYFSL